MEKGKIITVRLSSSRRRASLCIPLLQYIPVSEGVYQSLSWGVLVGRISTKQLCSFPPRGQGSTTSMVRAVLFFTVGIASSFRRGPGVAPVVWRASSPGATPDTFDAREFEDVLKRAPGSSIWGGGAGGTNEDVLRQIRNEQVAKAGEEIYRKYPFEETQLPLLPDCNNYYSGSFGDFFWHQNADQVYVFIPIDESIGKKDVEVKFQAKSVEVKVGGSQVVAFQCLERIIPDGSFWVVEASQKDGKRYIQLDLEKRFRMINWKNLFGVPATEGEAKSTADLESRSKMLEKLFAANKGMSRITGENAESVNDMLDNEDLVKMISDRVYGPTGAEDGEDMSGLLGEGIVLDTDEIHQRIDGSAK